MGDHRHEIEGLEKKITALSDALAKLSSKEDFQRLILIIHNPGWTTPAELAFSQAIVEHMSLQVRSLTTLKDHLLQASEAVGKQQAA
jgi:hypothetical protein